MIKKGCGRMNKAIYAGSFDPFTNGHFDILKKASKLFDEVHLLIAVNQNKVRKYNAIYMKEAIEQTLKNTNITNCKVVICNQLVGKYCEENGIEYSVRGLRNSMDFDYEENISKTNQFVNKNLETIYLRASSEYAAISSSSVKELFNYNMDVSELVPPEILPILRTY